MLIGIPREPNPEQTLVAGTPDSVKKLIKLGYEVVVESGAGEKAATSMTHTSRRARE